MSCVRCYVTAGAAQLSAHCKAGCKVIGRICVTACTHNQCPHLHDPVSPHCFNVLSQHLSNVLSRLDLATGVDSAKEHGTLGAHRQHVEYGPVLRVTPAINADGDASGLGAIVPLLQRLLNALLSRVQARSPQRVVGHRLVGGSGRAVFLPGGM